MPPPADSVSPHAIARIASALAELLVKRPAAVVVLSILCVIGIAIYRASDFVRADPIIFGLFVVLVLGALLIAVWIARSVGATDENGERPIGGDGG